MSDPFDEDLDTDEATPPPIRIRTCRRITPEVVTRAVVVTPPQPEPKPKHRGRWLAGGALVAGGAMAVLTPERRRVVVEVVAVLVAAVLLGLAAILAGLLVAGLAVDDSATFTVPASSTPAVPLPPQPGPTCVWGSLC